MERIVNGHLDEVCVNTLRFLAVDMVQRAESGHPGMPMGAAPMAYTLWDRFLRFNPADPSWPDRDRFVLSGGHGCALLYALLHLSGYDLPMTELERFRQWGSRTPGHPESGLTPGVEATTGPLGQGISNAVGMALAEAALAARFNRPGHTVVDHRTYVICSDGDLMEGVASEAASLAGHLELGKLIVLYDDNSISIEGSTDLAFTEDRIARFAAYGWHTQRVDDGTDIAAIEEAIRQARAASTQPSFIAVRTIIGHGSPNKQGTASAHGEPLGAEETRLAKESLGWPVEPTFHVPAEALARFRSAIARGAAWQAEWHGRLEEYAGAFPELAAEFERRIAGELPEGWTDGLPAFTPQEGPMATRDAGGLVMNALAAGVPELMGGSADLAPSTKTLLSGYPDFSATSRAGRNLRFGVREHGMASILNGMAYHGGFVPYGSTFLLFSDYMRPALRLAALSALHVIHVFTHDSVGLGEDGPTHQPVEHLLALRAIPHVLLVRPADANETSSAWRIALEHTDGPVLLALSRQKLPVLDPAVYPHVAEGTLRGGYVLADDGPEGGGVPDVTLVATGSEVHLALEARGILASEGRRARVVSMPSVSLFVAQEEAYRAYVLPDGAPVVAVEAGATLGWRTYLADGPSVVGIDRFGASAPGDTVMTGLGVTPLDVVALARHDIERWKSRSGE
ncbi:MAG TPA: transketolase [Coriobacteriia bacterium]|nr:transketolase [Coriobacteriia bacterium]